MNLAIYLQDQLEAFDRKPELKESYINGDDLISLGLLPGPDFGRLLKEARDRQLEGEITSRIQALGWLKAQVEEIAKKKLEDLNTTDIAAAMRTIEGTCRSMGINVVR